VSKSGKYCRCGNAISSAGRRNGRQVFKRICSQCRRNKLYAKYKRGFCEVCGFIPDWLGQLDVDHIDGDSNNNDRCNLKTLCANCHRLKTHRQKDYMKYLYRNTDAS
jgi:5-methylcytosine-specific restriction endonuclease McrA